MSLIFAYFVELLLQTTCLFLLTVFGNHIIKFIFKLCDEKKQNDGNKLGRVIGSFERVLMAVGMYLNKWDIVTGVIALKALARYKQMDNKDFAEYFLIGSMSSILYCLLCVGLYKTYIEFFDVFRMEYLINFFN